MASYTAVALTLSFAAGCSSDTIDVEAQPFFFSHLADDKTIMETGRAYRRANREEDDKNRLKELLLANNSLTGEANYKAIQDIVVNKVNNDFKTGRINTVTGWVLSLTEARQCALFSILHS